MCIAPMTEPEITNIIHDFDISGTLLTVNSYGSGHIHQTYISEWSQNSSKVRYIHQCINNNVFKNVENLISNIDIVLNHLNSKVDQSTYKKIKLIPAKNGKLFGKDSNQSYWRTYNYIEDTHYIDVSQNTQQVREAGRIIGYFQKQLIDLNVNTLNENIIKFTSSPHRLNQLREAISSNSPRVGLVSKEIELAESNSTLIAVIENELNNKNIPKRIVHGDTKINNVLFSTQTNNAVCLVDLDTCMPGYSLFDFGDLARSVSINLAEDEQDFSKIKFNQEFFQALVGGYLGEAKYFLNAKELGIMHLLPQLIALTLGIRFLTDYLNSDIYFKISRPEHNLERARTQFKIFETFKNNQNLIQKIIKNNH